MILNVGNAQDIAKEKKIIQEIVRVSHLISVKISVIYVLILKNYAHLNMVTVKIICAPRVISVVNPVVFFQTLGVNPVTKLKSFPISVKKFASYLFKLLEFISNGIFVISLLVTKI